MRKPVILKSLAAAAVLAMAGGCRPNVPAKYDHPFEGRVFDIMEPASKVAQDCASSWDLRPGQYAGACSWVFVWPDGSKNCLRILPDNQSALYLAEVKRIEQANCNGWAKEKAAHLEENHE